MIKAVVFDVDGVLIDNSSLIIEIFQEDARRAGLPIPSVEEIIAIFGLPWEEMIETLLGKDKRYKQIHRDVWSKYAQQTILASDIKEMLEVLKYKKGIVTSKPRESLIRHMGEYLKYFDSIITVEDTIKHKPDPDPLLKAIDQLDVKPEEVVYVGDHWRDYEMAKNAGTDFIGILSGALTKEEFEKIGVTKIVSSLKEIVGLIK